MFQSIIWRRGTITQNRMLESTFYVKNGDQIDFKPPILTIESTLPQLQDTSYCVKYALDGGQIHNRLHFFRNEMLAKSD